jgi:DMSO/TMAO reductase YedYZ heme-binding membrane subunit
MTTEREAKRHSCGMQRRLWRHYLPLLALSGGMVAAFAVALDQRAVQRLSIGTGYAALALLAFTLSVGPLRAVRGRRLPVSIDLRRDAGISTLLAISSDRAIRRLGARRWKRVQRLAYALFALVAAHTVLYQLVEERAAALVGAGAAVMGATVALQLAGARRRARRPHPLPTRG